MLPELGVSHAALLQGPAGFFMARFARELRGAGIETTKVNFHAGDVLFYRGPDAVAFREPFDAWPGWFSELIDARGIDGVFVFGDRRPLHRAALAIAEERGLKGWCFEEGYVRPDWITLEEHGVNGSSRMPRDPEFFRGLDLEPTVPPLPVGPTSGRIGLMSTFNALAFTHLNQGFPHYRHHRPLNAWYHTFVHCRAAVRRSLYARREVHVLPMLQERWDGRYFFVPLQVHCDFQLDHSPYEEVLDFVREVTAEFVRSAPSDHALVFKHHPMDNYREYGDFFVELAREHGLTDRLVYCHDTDLGALIAHAAGTVTINSTVGLISIARGTPVKALGTAVYDMEGLAHQGELASFFVRREPIDRALYVQFERYLTRTNQCNGSFYRGIESVPTPTGIRWFPQPFRGEAEAETVAGSGGTPPRRMLT